MKNLKVRIVWSFRLNLRSIDHHFEGIEKLIKPFRENKPSINCSSETWMTESSAKSAYTLESYALMEF